MLKGVLLIHALCVGITWCRPAIVTTDYCHRSGKQCKWHDLQRLRSTSEPECKIACDRNQDCKGYEVDANSPNCWLLKYACQDHELVDSTHIDNYVRKESDETCEWLNNCDFVSYDYVMYTDKECLGQTIHIYPVTTVQYCKEVCSKFCYCKAFEIDENHCSLRDHVCQHSEQLTARGTDYYIKDIYVPRPTELAIVDERYVMCLNCDAGKVLRIDTAVYGCTNLNHCTPSCNRDVKNKVKSFCENRRVCGVRANNDMFGDPCVGTHKYLYVNHECVIGPLCNKKSYDYCRRPGKDCYGHDIRAFVATTLQNCKKACDKECRCRSIQFKDYCWLKDYVCTDSELSTTAGKNDDIKRVVGEKECPLVEYA